MMNSLIKTIEVFELFSSLKVHWEKSSVCGINLDNSRIAQLDSRLHCKVDALSLFYLGLPSVGF